MEKFILRGEHAETRKKFLLNLPVSKRFKHVAIKSSETRIFPELLISMAVKRMKFENCIPSHLPLLEENIRITAKLSSIYYKAIRFHSVRVR